MRRALAAMLMLAGVLALADAALTFVWQEPLSALAARRAQPRLRAELRALTLATPAPSGAQRRAASAASARALRARTRDGDAVARLRISRLGLDAVVVRGTRPGDLEEAPGLFDAARLPGERGTALIAGHRTTYGAPFRHIDRLRRGDRITVAMPYGTFRYAVSQLIPEMTRVAWKHKQDDIRQLAPTVQPNAFVYSFTRRQYEQAYGTKYRKPGVLARFIGLLTRVMPKIGPLSALKFRVPTPAAEKLFAESFRETREKYRALIIDARDGRVQLPNTDFDVGRAPRWGENAVADRAYVELLEKLAERNFSSTPAPLKRAITQFFAQMDATQADKKLRKKVASVRTLITQLNAL